MGKRVPNKVVAESAAAQEWQIAQAWSDAQAIADGDRRVGSWDRISDALIQELQRRSRLDRSERP